MYVLYDLGCQFNPGLLRVGIETLVAPLDSVDLRGLIVEVQGHYYLSNHYIQSWTKATTSYNGSFNMLGIEKYMFSGPSLGKFQRLYYFLHRCVVLSCNHKCVIWHK